jgi:hypothetical protein
MKTKHKIFRLDDETYAYLSRMDNQTKLLTETLRLRREEVRQALACLADEPASEILRLIAEAGGETYTMDRATALRCLARELAAGNTALRRILEHD